MICKPCRVAADYGLPGIHRRCSGCSCEHRPLTSPAREQSSDLLLRMIETSWRPTPKETQR